MDARFSLRHLYSLIWYLILPAVLLRLWWRGRRAPEYRRHWRQRLGYIALPPSPPDWIWLHAVSVGEVQAAAPLIRALLERYSAYGILVTTTTPTGKAALQRLFPDSISHAYLPYDLPGAVGRFLATVKPCYAIIMETELWPNLLHHCNARRIPLLLANARLSARSARGYRLIRSFVVDMFDAFQTIATQSDGDRQRFIALGAEPDRVTVVGNLKFDAAPPLDTVARGHALRRQIGLNRPVWIAASTHEGEDAIVLDAHQRIRCQLPSALLILVPRHPERFDAVFALCTEMELKPVRFTRLAEGTHESAVLLVDAMGELLRAYAAADIAFVGGSLVATGGHNPLEPASLGIPIVSGPHVFNFELIYRLLRAADAVGVVKGSEALAQSIIDGLTDRGAAAARAERASAICEQYRGATDRLMRLIVA